MRILAQIVFLSALIASHFSQVFENSGKKLSKVETLRKRALASSNYIIEFTAKDYNYFIESGPRPYDVVILFMADNNQVCSEVFHEYKIVADFFKQKLSHFTSRDDGKIKRPVFFANIRHNSGTAKVFRKLDLRGVPILLVSKPRELTYTDPLEKKMYQRWFLWEIQKSDGVITAKKLMPWVNQKTDRNIAYVESIWTFLEALWYTCLLIGAVIMVYYYAKDFVLHPMVWTVGIFIILFISYAGVVFDILNNVPWSGVDKNGKQIFIAKGSRTQYVSEGFFMSFSIVAVAALWILYTKLPSIVDSMIVRLASTIFVVWIIWGLVNQVEYVFRSKNSYAPNYLPPKDYLKGPLNVDQGRYL